MWYTCSGIISYQKQDGQKSNLIVNNKRGPTKGCRTQRHAGRQVGVLNKVLDIISPKS